MELASQGRFKRLLAITTAEQCDHLSAEIQELLDESLEQAIMTHADHFDRIENLIATDLPLGSLFRIRDNLTKSLLNV